MNNSHLLAQIDQAFASGKTQQGLALLREYNRSNDSDAASWHRQANIEEQIGDFSDAGEAHFRCIEIAPNNAIGYLYGGYWLQQNGQQTIAAAALYSLAYDLDPSILTLWQQAHISAPTQTRSKEADRVMREVFSEQHRLVCSGLNNAERIANAQWVQTSDQAVSFIKENFAPELFFIPELSAKPFYSVEDFAWGQDLIDSSSKIKNELSHAMQQQLTKQCLRPYLDDNFIHHSNLSELANSNNWLAIDLFKNGELNTEISSLFPETLGVLATLPTYNLNQNPFEAFFSFLKPHQTIAPHYGQSNHALTLHLALDIPAHCYIEVGAQKQSWREGEALIFDDSFLHSAHNNSDQTRIVLILSIWHPDLSDDEQNAIRQCFKARQKLISERQSHLQKLRTS